MKTSRSKQEKFNSPQFRILTDILRAFEPHMEVAASERGIYYLTYLSDSNGRKGELFAALIDTKKECLLYVDELYADVLSNLPRLHDYVNQDKKALCFTDVISWDCQWDIRTMLKNIREKSEQIDINNVNPVEPEQSTNIK